MAQKWPNLVQNLHFWSFWAKYCHSLHILSNARPKNNVNKVPRWVFRYVGIKTFDFSSKKKNFLPQNDQIWAKIGIFGQFEPGHAGLFNALLWVGWWLGARAVSRKTPIYFIYLSKFCKSYNAVVNACFSTHLTGLCKEFDVEAGFFAVLGYIWKVLVLCH